MKHIFITLMALALSLAASAETSTESGYYIGDINSDQKVDIQDVALMVKVLKGEMTATEPCHLDDDDDVDLEDLNILTQLILTNADMVWVSSSIPYKGGNGADGAPTVAESKGKAFDASTDK